MSAKLQQDSDDLSENHEINVTPFIDVMLVLLIIFMVAAPLSTVDVAVDLPVARANPQPRPDKPVYVSVKSDLTISLGNNSISEDSLGSSLAALTNSDREQRIFLRADKTVPYGELMRIMNLLRAEGYLKIALVGLEDASPLPDTQPAIPRQ
jgi:biopolymer transport protein ExbD